MHLNGGQSGERKCLQFYKFKTGIEFYGIHWFEHWPVNKIFIKNYKKKKNSAAN